MEFLLIVLVLERLTPAALLAAAFLFMVDLLTPELFLVLVVARLFNDEVLVPLVFKLLFAVEDRLLKPELLPVLLGSLNA